ncbi:MAG TPA: hypothetical protein ACFYD0_12020 [Candidatus Wunengus sp. YC65]|uniref:hypothetical protein n=1 Tax=Candidatus Wunengus sp. YC65 TaxID=3367701 RepID=UPI004027E6EB
MFWKQGNKAVYRKFNSIKDTLFQPNNVATHYTKRLLTSTDASERQVLGQVLLEEMARYLSIPVPQLTVNDKRQNHSLKDGNTGGRTCPEDIPRYPHPRVYASLRLRSAQIPNEFTHGRFLLQAGRCDEKADRTRNYLKLWKGLKRICQP